MPIFINNENLKCELHHLKLHNYKINYNINIKTNQPISK